MGRPRKIPNTTAPRKDVDGIIAEPVDENQYYRGNKKIPKSGAQFEWTPEMVKELNKCKENIIYFAENYFTITNLDRGKEVIKLYTKQKQVLRSLMNNRFVCLLSSRQAGKSTLMTIYVLWITCFAADQRAVIVANKENTAINIFKRVRLAYEQLPNFLKPGVKEYGSTGLVFDNDSSIGVSTTTSTAARGESINALIIDEMAFIENHLIEDFWKSVIPVISSGKKSKIFTVSTPNGTGNKFYEIYSGAEKGETEWTAERIDWWDIPGRTERWKSQMISTLGSEESFSQEFGNSFLDSGDSAIGAAVIERFKERKKEPIWTGEEGCYKVFEEPSSEKLYVIGVDVGEGIGRAYSVAQVLDVTDLKEIKQVAVYSTNTLEPFHYANKLKFLCDQWGMPPLLIERNNCGAQVIDALFHKHMYERIVSCSKLTSVQVSGSTTRQLGVHSHNNMRHASVANLRYWMNTLQVVDINDVDTIQELETFIRYPNGVYRKKNDTYTDDKVMAMVWALFILETEVCQQYFDITEHDTQNKPLEITSNNFFNVDKSKYVIGPLVLNHITDPNNDFTARTKYKPLLTYEEVDRMEELSSLDMDSLFEQGYTLLDN